MGEAGYATGGFVANTSYCGRPTGLNRGFVRWEDAPFTIGELLRHSRPIFLLADSGLGSLLGVYDHIGRIGGKQVTESLHWELLTFAVIYLLLQAIVRGRRLAREGR